MRDVDDAVETAYVSAFVPRTLRVDLERAAAANDRTLSAEIRVALARHLAAPDRELATARHAP